ncbi:transporter substrate-binding domain-containing protein [Undibacterium sp.]|uniref:substrate-binding periplasmic protein n=1 Tax=Undibacterium sp. TaxID=1914977 RepID=UPI002CA8FAC2|nr:transporter substrate-binding domain-containing protein [Undibacterium sp.]HTD06843.1 transporter substrate-binding domain-containing protein [Undibacterium sp.]
MALENCRAQDQGNNAVLAQFKVNRVSGPWLRQVFRAALLSALSCAPIAALAECSRPIVAPMSPTGMAVIIAKDQFSGAYIDVLHSVGKKEGCSFVFSAVPRARQEAMFQAGQSDLLLPATRLPQRDEAGIFVPLVTVRAALISLESARPAVHNLQELQQRHELKVALLRGYDYGDAYQALIKELKKQGRLILEADPTSIARLLMAGVADATIMTPPIFTGAVQMDSRLQSMQGKLRYEALDDLPWIDSGAYISKSSLSAEDRGLLQDLFERVAKSGSLWTSIHRYEQPDSMKESVRPRGGAKQAVN